MTFDPARELELFAIPSTGSGAKSHPSNRSLRFAFSAAACSGWFKSKAAGTLASITSGMILFPDERAPLVVPAQPPEKLLPTRSQTNQKRELDRPSKRSLKAPKMSQVVQRVYSQQRLDGCSSYDQEWRILVKLDSPCDSGVGCL